MENKQREYNCFQRSVLMLQGWHQLQKLRQIANNRRIQDSDSCPLRQDQTVEIEGQAIFQQFSDSENPHESYFIFWQLIIAQFKTEFIIAYLLIQGSCLAKVGLAFSVGYILDNLESDNRQLSLAFTGVAGACWILQYYLSENGWRFVQQFSIRIKGAITYALYRKILNMPGNEIEGDDQGIVTNAVAEFHDILQNQFVYFFYLLAAPLTGIGFGAMLVLRVGWIAVSGVGLTILCELIHYYFADYNSKHISGISDEKDKRMRTMGQILSRLRYIKMQTWQIIFMEKVLTFRNAEFKAYTKYGAGLALEMALNEGISDFSLLLILGLTYFMDNELSSKTIILTVLCVLLLKLLIICSSYGVNCLYMLRVLFQRIFIIMQRNTVKMKKITDKQIEPNDKQQQQRGNSTSNVQLHDHGNIEQLNPSTDAIIILNKASILYKKQEQICTILEDLTIQVKNKQFIGVFGGVGSGKTSFLNILAGQSSLYSGQVLVNLPFAYLQQDPVLFSGTLQQNILFGREMKEDLYSKVLEYSCFSDDLAQLSNGDLTMIEEGAVNLSGGQRTRLGLARVLYADKAILLLDDPLSSLDPKVMQKIMRNLQRLNREEEKTIILATHHTHCLTECSKCIKIENKKATILTEEQFIQLKQTYENEKQNNSRQEFLSDSKMENFLNVEEKNKDEKRLSRSILDKTEQIRQKQQNQLLQNYQIAGKKGFIMTIFSYFYNNKQNKLVFTLALIGFAVSEALYALLIFFLEDYDKVIGNKSLYFSTMTYYWMTLLIIVGIIFPLQLIRTYLLNLAIQLSNKQLHDSALESLLRSKVMEVDALGTKGIIDKFTTDLGMLDVGIQVDIAGQFIVITSAFSQFIIIAILEPILLVFALALFILLYFWNKHCSEMIMIAKQVDLQMKGPILGHFSETMKGLVQIDVLQSKDYMLNNFKAMLERSMKTSYTYRRIMRVYSSYSAYMTNAIMVASCFVLAHFSDSSNYLTFALAAVVLIDINDCIFFIMEYCIFLTSNLVSADRIKSLNNLSAQNQNYSMNNLKKNINKNPQEESHGTEVFIYNQTSRVNQQIEASLTKGIFLINISLKYGKTEKALENLSLQIETGKKIAIVGRTGSGKSSLVQVLYRLIEPEIGSVYQINNRNALQLSLKDLRSQLTCIPQVPFIFNDSVRRNLDPFCQYADQQIKRALQAVKMLETIEKTQGGLSASFEQGEISLSAGQKQLLCLARAILEKRDFLILDEATANIDHETDAVIQAVLRQRFKASTIVTVAHRLQTILDYDTIVVLSKGHMIEAGSAAELLKRRGEFYQMIMNSSNREELVFRIEKSNH